MTLATSKHVFKIKTCRNLFENHDLLSAVSTFYSSLVLLALAMLKFIDEAECYFQELTKCHHLHWPGPSCSKAAYHYPPDTALSSGYLSVSKTNHAIYWIVIYLFDSMIHFSNNLGLVLFVIQGFMMCVLA